MRLRSLSLLAAVAAFVATPAVAAPNAAASLSIAKAARAGAPAAHGSKLLTGGALYALAGFLVVVAGAVLAHELGEDDSDSN